MDVSNNTPITTFSADYRGKKLNSVMPDNMTALRATIIQEFPEFEGVIFYLSPEGRFLPLDSEEAIKKALAPGKSLSLFLQPSVEHGMRLERMHFSKWVDKNDYRQLMPAIVLLKREGFKGKDIKNNVNLLLQFAGDLDATLCAFHSICHAKGKGKRDKKDKKERKEKKREKREKKEKRGHKRKDSCGREEGKRCKKSKIVESETNVPGERFVGQTQELASEFREMSINAYSDDVSDKILAGKFRKIIIDGNNLLFITSALRNFSLQGGKVKAEKMICIASFVFSQLAGIDAEVIFDMTKLPTVNRFKIDLGQASEIQIPKCTSLDQFNAEVSKFVSNFPLVGTPIKTSQSDFVITSAKPHFRSSDDKLIAWAKLNMSSNPVGNFSGDISNSSNQPLNPNLVTVVVTSDRALAGELSGLGVALIKPVQFVLLLLSLVKKITGTVESMEDVVEGKPDEKDSKAEEKFGEAEEKDSKTEKNSSLKWFDSVFAPFVRKE
jgi:hypothetical protein